MPTPTRDGYTFDGWRTGLDTKITEYTGVSRSVDHTLRAAWIENSSSTENPPANLTDGGSTENNRPAFSGVSAYISNGQIALSGSVTASGGINYVEVTVDNSADDRCAYAYVKVGTPFGSQSTYSLSNLTSTLNASLDRFGIPLENDTFTLRIVAVGFGGNNGTTGISNSMEVPL